ncbi:MAG TPA: proton-conducting transporter membrane subunit [Candidatus Dormibacteraeota bacterium]|nr:proton-conducting transporter membrane subunit [Candidatus Dormibacteraeota bacterium]
MSAVLTGLLAGAGGLWLLAAAVGLGARRPGPLAAATRLSAVGGLVALAGGVAAVLQPRALVVQLGSGVVGPAAWRVTPLAGVFLALLGLVALAIGAYAGRAHRPGRGTALYLAAYNLALVAALGVLSAGSVTTFLVAWESMTVCSYLLVLRHQDRPGVARGAFLFLALGEVGFACIVAALAILAVQTGTLSFAAIATRAPHLAAGWRDAVFLLALVGFGFKAGVVPWHLALPAADPVAPADGAAFLSGLVTKLGIYGMVLVGVELVPGGPAWWGLVMLALGVASAVLGILYALMERDWKRFLAYSTIENVGIVLIALGAALTFFESRQPAVGALLLIAALYHVLNHGTYKTLLFLEAGVVEHAAGSRDLDRLGGLLRRMPRAALVTLVGTLGIAALPPLNGFVSEWLIFQGLFQGFRIPSHVVGVCLVVAGAAMALSGGLAINAFARAFGIPFLGLARSPGAAAAEEREEPVVGPALLATACVFLAVGAPLVLTALDHAAAAATGTDILSRLIVPGLTVIPAHTDFSAFSPTYLAVCLLAMLLVPALIVRSRRPAAPTRVGPVWAGGILRFRSRMQYTATTHANPVRVTFEGLYRPHTEVTRASDDPAGRSGPVHYRFQVTPLFERLLYTPVVRAVERVARLARPIQSGDVNLYLLYVFVAVLIAYLLGVH